MPSTPGYESEPSPAKGSVKPVRAVSKSHQLRVCIRTVVAEHIGSAQGPETVLLWRKRVVTFLTPNCRRPSLSTLGVSFVHPKKLPQMGRIEDRRVAKSAIAARVITTQDHK